MNPRRIVEAYLDSFYREHKDFERIESLLAEGFTFIDDSWRRRLPVRFSALSEKCLEMLLNTGPWTTAITSPIMEKKKPS